MTTMTTVTLRRAILPSTRARVPLLRPTTTATFSIRSTAPRYSDTNTHHQIYTHPFSFGFWNSLVPRFMRPSQWKKWNKKGEWNPMTFYIVMYMLIGSMSINLLIIKHQRDDFERVSIVRIELLKEVMEKIRSGEKVDVEKMLGTGDPKKEHDWEELLQEIEREEAPRGGRGKDSKTQPPPDPKPSTEEAPTKPRPKLPRPSFF